MNPSQGKAAFPGSTTVSNPPRQCLSRRGRLGRRTPGGRGPGARVSAAVASPNSRHLKEVECLVRAGQVPKHGVRKGSPGRINLVVRVTS